MNNQELELKVKEILSIGNYFDMIEEVVNFEKEYKTSDFFKLTKKSLVDVVKEARSWYMFDDIGEKIQDLIDNLNFENFNDIISQFGGMYAQENSDVLNIVKEFKDLVK